MPKKIYYIVGILSIFSLSLMFQTFTLVVSFNLTVDDPENDVYYFHTTSEDYEMKKGDYHDEIDIIRFEVTGQHFNLTFAADIGDWGNTHYAMIMLHPDFHGFTQAPTYPYYAILYENHSANGLGYLGFHVFFLNVTSAYTEQYWNVTMGWVSDISLASDIGSASDRSIIADLPMDAYTIPDDIDCIALSNYLIIFFLIEDTYQYTDIAPNKYDPYGDKGNNIPSYNLFIVVGLLFGISLIIGKKYLKKK